MSDSVRYVMFVITGSQVTFRVYGVTCLIVLILYAVLKYFLEDRGSFSHGAKDAHQMLEEESPTLHLAPHGVPSGMARDLSSSKLKEEGITSDRIVFNATFANIQ